MKRLTQTVLCCLILATDGLVAHPGQHEQIQRITATIEQRPDEQFPYIQRGAIFSLAAQYQQASEDFERAEQLGPPALVAYERGLLYHRQGEFDRARRYFDQYIEQFPRNAAAYEARAQVSRDAGNYSAAVQDLNHYFDLQPQPHPGNYLSAAEMLSDMGRPTEALALLDRGMEKLGLTPQLQRRAVEMERQQGNLEGAILRLESLRLPLRENPAWQLEMAQLYVLDGQPQLAQTLLSDLAQELSGLRATPARQKLLQQTRELQTAVARFKAPLTATIRPASRPPY